MHFLRTILLVLTTCSSLFSQNYATIDAHARNSKAYRNLKVDELALSLSAPCKTEKEKVRAFYVWIADNIRYDISTFQNRKEMDPEDRAELQMPQQVIKRKKAVCMGYTYLMNELCKSVGIEALFVGGLTKNHTGRVSRLTHAWSLVRTDGSWGLIDATWGSGSIDIESGKYEEIFKEEYFLSAPDVLIKNHFPDDPLFQLLPTPLTFAAFEKGEKPVEAALPEYAQLTDSLNALVSMDTLFMFWTTGTRLLKYDPQGNLGFYNMGRYHYQNSINYMNQLASSYNEVKTNPKVFNQNWCDRQNEVVLNYEESLKKGLETLKKATKNDHHARKIVAYRNSMQRSLSSVDQKKVTLKKNCDQLKNRQKRN